ncbi:MAG: hypothetical protein ACUVV5_05685 [Candidatus Aminicenantales bacterium]
MLPRVSVAARGGEALAGTLSPLPALKDSLAPFLGLRPTTMKRYPHGIPSDSRFFSRREMTALVPSRRGAEGGFRLTL